MLFIKVLKKDAETLKRKLKAQKKLVFGVPFFTDESYVFIPVTSPVDGYESIEKDAHADLKPRSLKEALQKEFSQEEIDLLSSSMDVIGHIAIVNIPEDLIDFKRHIADAVILINKNIETVCMKIGPTAGEFRIRPIEVISGIDNTITRYKEHGAVMEMDVAKTYFSPRLAFERQRIASLIKSGETINAMFAGVGPFPLVIAKKTPDVSKIFATEINPDSFVYLEKNIALNHMQDKIIPYLGNVRDVVPNFPQCDRVLMTLPKGAHAFLDLAISSCVDGGIVHFYHFAQNECMVDEATDLVHKAAAQMSRNATILGTKVVRSFAPGISQLVVDFQVS